jgi:hypothetical protein
VTDWWLSDLAGPVHLVGIAGMALMVTSMLYTLRKRKWVITQGKMTLWLSWHHWAGFIGGVLALVHTLGNYSGLGTVLVAMLLLVLGTSGIYFLERRSRRPLTEATGELARARGERKELDASYRQMHAAGRSGTPQGIAAYEALMAKHTQVVEGEKRVAELKQKGVSWTWWRTLHNVGTMMLVGVLLVHIWVALHFSGVGL